MELENATCYQSVNKSVNQPTYLTHFSTLGYKVSIVVNSRKWVARNVNV